MLGFVPQRQPTTVGFGINAFSVRSGVLKVDEKNDRINRINRFLDMLRFSYVIMLLPKVNDALI